MVRPANADKGSGGSLSPLRDVSTGEIIAPFPKTSNGVSALSGIFLTFHDFSWGLNYSIANFFSASQVTRLLERLGETDVIEGDDARLRRLRLHVGILLIPGT